VSTAMRTAMNGRLSSMRGMEQHFLRRVDRRPILAQSEGERTARAANRYFYLLT
jgi:hypothetical protein